MASSVAQSRAWEAEDDLRTLERAEEVRGDAKRMSRASACAHKKMAALKKLTKGRSTSKGRR